MCRWSTKYQPRKLADVVGQPCVKVLQSFVLEPYPECFILEGGGGCGKSTAAASLSRDLGADPDDMLSGCITLAAADLTVDRARDLFTRIVRLRPMVGSRWHVVIIEELEFLSPQAERLLKDLLDPNKMPDYTVVLATSNGVGRMSGPFLQRFRTLAFSNGEDFAEACYEKLAAVWTAETGEHELPSGAQHWGWSQEGTIQEFSMRSCLDFAQRIAATRRVPVTA